MAYDDSAPESPAPRPTQLYTVKAAEHKKNLPDQQGRKPLQVVKLTLAPKSGDPPELRGEITQLQATAIPTVGVDIELEAEHDPKWGWKFKRPQRGGGGGGGRRDDPLATRRMSRYAALDRAMRWLELKHQRGELPSATLDLTTHLLPVVKWCERAATVEKLDDLKPTAPRS